jgi:hypothetical protein
MEGAPAGSAREWMIYPGDESPFVYNPRVHSHLYVQALAERYPAEVAESILQQAAELEARAKALGYSTAVEEHGLDEVLGPELPPYTEPGPPA